MSDFDIAKSEFRPLGFSTRTINALVVHGISTLRDLGAVSEREVSRMSGIGPGALQQLRIYLRKPDPTLELHTRSKAVATIFDAKSLTAIDAWAVDQDIPSRAEAVRRLVDLGLALPKAKR